jgi:hypothetical protein
LNTINEPPPRVASTSKDISDLQQIDILLELAGPHLAEAIKALDFPEVYGLDDPKSQARARKKLRAEIEWVGDCMRRAKALTEAAWQREIELAFEKTVREMVNEEIARAAGP